jgi:hypothetical protein
VEELKDTRKSPADGENSSDKKLYQKPEVAKYDDLTEVTGGGPSSNPD